MKIPDINIDNGHKETLFFWAIIYGAIVLFFGTELLGLGLWLKVTGFVLPSPETMSNLMGGFVGVLYTFVLIVAHIGAIIFASFYNFFFWKEKAVKWHKKYDLTKFYDRYS